MPRDRKRPVTYGKSPLNRLQPHAPFSRKPIGPLTTSTPTDDKLAAAIAPSPKSSARSLHPSCAPESPPGSISSQLENEGERSSMRTKRRRLLREEPSLDYTRSQLKSSESTSPESDSCRNKNLTSIEPFHDDQNRKSSCVIRSPRSDVSSENDSKSALQSPSEYWRSARRQKPTSLSQNNNRIIKADLNSTSKKDHVVPTRRRLVDLLGTKREGDDLRHRVSDNTPGSAPISNSSDVDGLHSDLQRQVSPQVRPQSGLRSYDRKRGDSSASIAPMLRSSGVTYSRQRSFMNDSDSLTGSEPHGMRKPPQTEIGKAPYPIGFSGLPSGEEDADNGKPVRSIHELRQAGDNARFREVVDSTFEDFESPHLSQSERCCGLAELCAKLLNPQFAHRFSEHGFDDRLVDCTPNTLDIVSAFLTLSAYKLILCGGHASRPFFESSWARILEIAPPLLDVEDDFIALVRNPSSGLSKTAQASVRGLRSHLCSLVGFNAPCLSPQLLTLECMKSSLIALRESGHTIHPIPLPMLRKLVTLMESFAPGDLNNSSLADHFRFLALGFSILENYSVISESFDHDHAQCFQRLSQLHGLLTLGHSDSNRQMLLSYIRAVLNLTNKEPALCDSFAVPAIVCNLAIIVIKDLRLMSGDSIDKESSLLDEIILALGALINLSENTERSRDILTDSDSHPATLLHQLLEQFFARVTSIDQANSVPEVHRNVVAGYLSIFLLTICLNKGARLIVKNFTSGNGLELILSTAEKFLQYHRKVEKDTQLFETREQRESRLTTRLEHIISQIRLLDEHATTEP
ncbi:wings apart-like protein regulation of heterochromatin-domain-containing protein [Aspergillus filifer]